MGCRSGERKIGFEKFVAVGLRERKARVQPRRKRDQIFIR